MPPSHSRVANSKTLDLVSYTKKTNGDPLRPSDPVKQSRWFRDLSTWTPKQDPCFKELIKHGYITVKDYVYVSSLHMATDYVNGRLPSDSTFIKPAPLKYVRSAAVSAVYASSTSHVELTHADLPALKIVVSFAQLEKASQNLCDVITSTCPHEHSFFC